MSPTADPLPREFRFVAACCIWPPSPRRDEAVRASVTPDFDWQTLLKVVARQRVPGLVHNAVMTAGVAPPRDVAARIQAGAHRTARESLHLAARSLELQRRFDEAGITLLLMKGSALAMQAYGGLAIKHSRDIDLVVLPQQVAQSVTLLEGMGYHAVPPVPPPGSAQFQRWMRYGLEFVLYRDGDVMPVELHWRFLENPDLMAGVSAASPSQDIAIPGAGNLRTLADDTQFTYLCGHGAFHGWSRLKWLADVNALLVNDSEARLRERLAIAKAMKIGQGVAQAYLLCDRLFATPALAPIARELRRHWKFRKLESVGLKAMTRGGGTQELNAVAYGEFPILMSHFLLGQGVGHVAHELWHKLNRPYDMLHDDGIGRLQWLYPLARVAAWVGRRGKLRDLPRR